jgi:hypothetical protein
MHGQAESLHLAFDIPGREFGLPGQFLDGALTPMKRVTVVSAHVSVVPGADDSKLLDAEGEC